LKSEPAYNQQLKTQVSDFSYGFKQGIPIGLGYIPVSFTFGLMAVNGGIPILAAILISMTNMTSAGQFAGVNLIIQGASMMELAVTTFVVNLRYMLMSLSVSQKLSPRISAAKRYIIAFGITDEIFAISSMEKGELTFSYMMGLTLSPYLGWALGTAMGAVTSSLLPPALQSSMGIALYGMFIALVVPAAKRSRAALIVAITAIAVSCIFTWVPYMNHISGGWVIIVATMIASSIGALIFPREDDENE